VDVALQLIAALASLATAVGVLVAARQLALSKQQARTDFEDQLNAQYRELVRQLPVEALLGEPLTPAVQASHLGAFYHYFDLSNEQAFLWRQGRVSRGTWDNWVEGIEQNLRRPAFSAAWVEVSTRAPESFNDLRTLVPLAPSQLSGKPGHVTRATGAA
jgi:hypothetical protein